MQQEANKFTENIAKQANKLRILGFGENWDSELQSLSELRDGPYKVPYTTEINRHKVEFQLIFNVKENLVYLNKFEIGLVNIPFIEHKDINEKNTYDLERKMRTTDFHTYLNEGKPEDQLSVEEKNRVKLQVAILQSLDELSKHPEGKSIAEKLAVKYFADTKFAENIPNFNQIRENYSVRNTFPADFYESYRARQAYHLMNGRAVYTEILERPKPIEKPIEKAPSEAADENKKKAKGKGKAKEIVAEKPVRIAVWIQLDLNKRTAKEGNLFRNMYHKQTPDQIKSDGLAFNLEAKVSQFAFKELMNEKEKNSLLYRLENGEAPIVNWTDREGRQQSGRISANPQYKTFELRLDNNKLIKHDLVPKRTELEMSSIMETVNPIIAQHFGPDLPGSNGVTFPAPGGSAGKAQENELGM